MNTQELNLHINNVRSKLNSYIKANSLSVSEVARRVDLSHWTVHKLIKNIGTMKMENVCKIEEFLDDRANHDGCDCKTCFAHRKQVISPERTDYNVWMPNIRMDSE